VVQYKRAKRKVYDQLYGHDVVPLYLHKKTPTFRAIKELLPDLVFIEIPIENLLLDENITFFFSDGNIAAKKSTIFYKPEDIQNLPFEVINADYWPESPD
jgi:hypothetical protein